MSCPTESAPRIPSPQERLRHAFSSDIPDDMLERPTARATPRAARGRAWREARPVGRPVLRVVGVGGAGVNAVNRMVEAEVEGVEFLAVNTDLQSLQGSTADVTLHIGPDVTRGLGSGSNPELGRQAAMEDYDHIKALLKGSDMVFVAAGAGGGTGTGAAPVVARIARELGALTVGIVTKPFGFEGTRRARDGRGGHRPRSPRRSTRSSSCPNNRLLSVLDKQTSMVEAFRVADDVLRQGVQGISDLVTLPGLINLDFADVRTIMSEAGNALLGHRHGHRRAAGDRGRRGGRRRRRCWRRAWRAPARSCSRSPAGADLSLWEVNEAAKAVSEAAHPDANIIFGAMVDEKLDRRGVGDGRGHGLRARAARGGRSAAASRSRRASRASSVARRRRAPGARASA